MLNSKFNIQNSTLVGGPSWIRTSEAVKQQIYSLPRLSTSVPTHTVISTTDGIIVQLFGFVKLV